MLIQLLPVFAAYLIAINAVTWVSFWYDKQQARAGQRRIPELRLLTMAALGGSPAATRAGRRFRHKTQKQPFRMYLYRIRRWHRRLAVLSLGAVIIWLAQILLA